LSINPVLINFVVLHDPQTEFNFVTNIKNVAVFNFEACEGIPDGVWNFLEES
jgi:hypothetical protein